jgi:CubicO group peptidase (beta-lactamase class C family)
MKKSLLVIILLMTMTGVCSVQAQTAQPFDERLAVFESVLEDMRRELRIPGMSAALIKDRELVWARGFGYADLENKVEATEDTAYFLASLTKTFASTILMQLVEQGKLDLDDPVSKYGVRIKSPGTIWVRHLLSHTSEGLPGSFYNYRGDRFDHLGRVIKGASGRSFDNLLMEDIVRPLSMDDTVPGNRREEAEFGHIGAKMAKPYDLDSSGEIVESQYPTYFGVSGGLISTVTDMAKYVIAIDQNAIINQKTQQVAFTPQVLNSGSTAPYGLGWFVQEHEGTPLIWHYGYNRRRVSTLILYGPDQGLAFIIFANTDMLSRPFSLGLGDVLTSPAAVAFVKYFIAAERTGMAVPEISWNATEVEIGSQIERAQAAGYGAIVRKELASRILMHRELGEWEQAERHLDIYVDLYTQPPAAIDLPRIAAIESVADDQYRVMEFELRRDATIRVHAVGESDFYNYELFDFGGIEDASTGRLIWRMSLEQSKDAGGALQNRKVDQTIELQKGTYRLHYRTDGAHSFDRWNKIPPDELLWGISLYLADPSSHVDDVVGSVHSVQSTSEMRLLDAVEFPRAKPPIGPREYVALIVFLSFLVSAVVFPPARGLYKRLAGQKGRFDETPKSQRKWRSAVAWIAGINGVICFSHIFPALLGGRLEALVASGLSMPSGGWLAVLLSLPLASVCMVAFLIPVVVLSWWKRYWKLPLRIYYTLVVAAAVGYLVLSNHLRVIILPA